MVFEMLRKGEANAMTTSDLVRLTGLRNARELRAQIARERAKGFLILSSCRGRGGYYLPAEGAEGRLEIEQFCISIRARALNSPKREEGPGGAGGPARTFRGCGREGAL